MIFLLFSSSSSSCRYRHAGRLLARDAGLKGLSFVTLSEVLGLAYRFRGGRL